MSEASTNAKPEEQTIQTGFPPVYEELLQNQSDILKNGFEKTIERFEKVGREAKTIRVLLQDALRNSVSIKEDNKKTVTKATVSPVDTAKQDVLAKFVEKLAQVIKEQSKREIKNVTPGYINYNQPPRQLNRFFPEYTNRTIDKLQEQKPKGLQLAAPIDITDKKVTDKKPENSQATGKITPQTTALVPAGNMSNVVVTPAPMETGAEKALTQTSIPELLNDPEEKTIKVELVGINDKTIDKLKEMFEKIAGKKAKQTEGSDDDLGTIANLSNLLRNSKMGSILAKGAGLAVKQGGKLIGKTGKFLTNTAKGGGILYKAGMALRKTGGKIAGKGAAMAATKTAASTAGKAAATTAGKAAATTAAKTAATTSAKAIGKSVLKKLPIIGALAGGAFAIQRAMAGDMTGAGLELASGATSLIPGFGTAASIGIDAALVARDIAKAKKETEVTSTPGLNEATKLSSVEEPPPITAESALNKPAETGFITAPKESESVVAPAAIGPASTIATPPSTTTGTPATQQNPTELTDKLSSLIDILLTKETKIASNNIGNSNANTTIVNNNVQTSGGGEDAITSLRIKTSHLLSDRRRLA